MKFQPKTEHEIKMASLREPGVYDFTVNDASDEISKKGADMIKVTLGVFDANGHEFTLTDYLMEAMAFKLRHFSYAAGLGDAYEAGTLLASNMIGKSGKVKIVIKEDKTGAYPPKNEVKDYVVPDEKAGAQQDPMRKLEELGREHAPRRPVPSAVNDDSQPPFNRSEYEYLP